MLVLTRRKGESVRINDDIHCNILGVNGNQVKLGFKAPDSVLINREELYLVKLREQEKSKEA